MTKQTFKNAVLSACLLGLALSTSISLAQVGLASKLSGKRAPSAATQAASHQAKMPGSPSYTYTLLSFPGTLITEANGINLGATTSKIGIVGGYGASIEEGNLNQGGFLISVSGTKTVTETYQAVNVPHGPADQLADGINDSGQIVGIYYIGNSGPYQGYELSGGKFTPINVPGSEGTLPQAINNSGEVVGIWGAPGLGPTQGFTLIGGTYAPINAPGAGTGEGQGTYAEAVNSSGEIAGSYVDASGVSHGFLLSGGTYTSFDPPGSVATYAYGMNDAGDIVGEYCTTSECITSADGGLGFLLSNGVFTMITIPGEASTGLSGINNNGVLVGWYTDAAGLDVSFLATP